MWVSAIPQGGAIDHEENMALTIEYADGSMGTVVYTALGNFRVPKEYIEIYADGKIMVIDNFKKAKIVEPQKTRALNLWHQDKGYTREIEALVQAIRNGESSPMSLDEIMMSHLTTFKIEECVKSRKPIEFNLEEQ